MVVTLSSGLTDKVINVPTPQGTIEGRVYSGQTLPLALRGAYKEGYTPLSVPTIADAMLIAEKGSPVFDGGFVTTTLEATGRTPHGSLVYVIAHGYHPFVLPERIEQVRSSTFQHDVHRPGGELTNKEFYALLDMEDGRPISEGKKVYVLSEEQMKKEEEFGKKVWTADGHRGDYREHIMSEYPIEKVARSLVFTAFLGGEDRKLQWLQYLQRPREFGVGEFAYAHQAFLVDKNENANVGRLVHISGNTILGFQPLTLDWYNYTNLIVVPGAAERPRAVETVHEKGATLERLLTPIGRIFRGH